MKNITKVVSLFLNILFDYASFPFMIFKSNILCRYHLQRPFKCSYTGCDKSYTNSSHLNRHIKVFHEKLTKPVTCDVIGCHKELANSTSYKRHYTLHHNTEENAQRYVCDICKKSFRKKHALQQHIYTHSGEFPFRCVMRNVYQVSFNFWVDTYYFVIQSEQFNIRSGPLCEVHSQANYKTFKVSDETLFMWKK